MIVIKFIGHNYLVSSHISQYNKYIKIMYKYNLQYKDDATFICTIVTEFGRKCAYLSNNKEGRKISTKKNYICFKNKKKQAAVNWGKRMCLT